MRLRPDQRRYADDLLALRVPTDKDDARGDKILVPLGEVARAVPASGPSTIRRKDLQREVRISASNSGRSLGEVAADIEAAAASLKLAPGYDVLPGGDSEELKTMFRNMLQTLALAIIFIYLILASQFGSFFHPFAIMLSLPLSLVGVALALLSTGDSLNIMSMIGLIMLMGLVTKNAILLVDFTNQARAAGLPRDRGADQGRLDAAAADRDDDARDDLRHAAARLRDRRRRGDARADGARRDRRPDHLDAAHARRRAGRLHLPRRPAAGGGARVARRAAPPQARGRCGRE